MFFKRVCNERVLPMPEERELVGKFSWCNFDREWDSLHFFLDVLRHINFNASWCGDHYGYRVLTNEV